MKPAVLLMSHGSPDLPDQMGEYLRHIFTSRPVTDAMIAEFQERYRTFGGRSPLLDICRRLAAALEKSLGIPVRVGMRHWHPFIADAVRDLGDPIVGLPLAPQYSKWSTDKYFEALRAATTSRVVAIERWHLLPKFLDAWADRIREGLRRHSPDLVLFTAHSIPEQDAEPYATELRETVEGILKRVDVPWEFAYQSASPGSTRWLGPDVDAVLKTLRGKVMIAPIGFVCDNAEILYDIDHLYRASAEKLGIALTRCEMPNDHPGLVEALAEAVRQAL